MRVVGLKAFGAMMIMLNVRSVGIDVKKELYGRVVVPTVNSDLWNGNVGYEDG